MKNEIIRAIETAIEHQRATAELVDKLRTMIYDETDAEAIQNIEVLTRLMINELEYVRDAVIGDTISDKA